MSHYQRVRRGGEIGGPIKDRVVGCSLDGCERKHYAKGYCYLHYTRVRGKGEPGPDGPITASPEHGTSNMYGNHGCRCEDCKLANTARTSASLTTADDYRRLVAICETLDVSVATFARQAVLAAMEASA
jgi:hypothetical protein